MITNGILCFYENTPTGCLKPDCTFIHSRPRMNLRNPSAVIRRKIYFYLELIIFMYVFPLFFFIAPSTNLIKKDATKSNVPSVASTAVPQATPGVSSTVSPPQPTSS